MAITCPKCGAEFDATLFAFDHAVRCDCGMEIEYPGSDMRAGHVATQSATPPHPATPDQDSLLQAAHAAAMQLVADLDLARQHSNQWTNENLSCMLVEEALSECLHRLAETGCWGEANQLPSNEFWRIAGSQLESGVLQRHARLKPRGYAGDYQMLHWIDTQYCCEHPLGRAFDHFFQRQAAPQAVRYRMRQTAAALAAHCVKKEDGDYHVVSVGSGPAADIVQALSALPEDRRARVRVTLLDLDPEALEFAQRHMSALLRPDAIRSIRENLFRLPKNRKANALLGGPDFLICSGLFDYLDEMAATAMLRLFWQSLAANGVFLAWNFAPHNPTRAYMEWIGNWYLTYRTGGDLQRLALAADIPPNSFSAGAEALGIDLVLAARNVNCQLASGPLVFRDYALTQNS